MIGKGREGDKTMGKKEMRTVQERKGKKKTGKDREWKVMIGERGEEDREGEKTNKGKERVNGVSPELTAVATGVPIDPTHSHKRRSPYGTAKVTAVKLMHRISVRTKKGVGRNMRQGEEEGEEEEEEEEVQKVEVWV
ncbi:hypothetical protein GBF38_010948 [Nibea albiflora]|uniref:Uncharacterized protein n=1 Tax=Nibea albiflora TaxID=240163 RepID=A0ACB7ESZ5_NIBAL|nr:hypothetical protein GBF38_010948 [Nibea albiflora]